MKTPRQGIHRQTLISTSALLATLFTLAACTGEDQAAVKKVADGAAAKATTLAEQAKDAAQSAADAAKEAASTTANAARETAAKAAETTRELADRAGSAARKMADKAGESTTELIDKGGTAVRELGSDTASTTGEKVAAGTTAATSAAAGAAGTAVAGAAAATTTAAAGAATVKSAVTTKPLKAAWVYIGPVGDGGWTFAHDNGRKAAQAAMGDAMASTFVESVPETADAERVLRDLALQGNKIIFGTTFGYMETMRKLSREFPDVYWEHATGYKTTDNLRTYDSRTYQGAYLAGLIAGAMSVSNTLGVVGSIPIPEVVRNINSFTLGAQTMNPDIKTRVVWVNKWFDPPREAEAAQSLLDQGADVLFQNTDSSAVLQTAEKAGKLAFGWDSDMTAYGPKAHLGSAIINWGPYYTQQVKAAADGSWQTGRDWWGVPNGAIDLVSVSDRVPGPVKQAVERAKAGLKDGSLKIWAGPISNNDGKEVIAAGQVADDAFLGGLNFFVKGVEGKVPAGK